MVHLATDLTAVDNGTGQHEEGITEVRAVSMTQVLELVRSGVITDSESIAALMITLLHLGRVS